MAACSCSKAVETAKQSKETSINNANKYQSEQLPAAAAQVDSIIKQAEATRQGRINEAEGQVARFNAMYEEYVKNPLITKQRMFYETMEDILPNMKIYITDGSAQTLLPLDSFSNIDFAGTGSSNGSQAGSSGNPSADSAAADSANNRNGSGSAAGGAGTGSRTQEGSTEEDGEEDVEELEDGEEDSEEE